MLVESLVNIEVDELGNEGARHCCGKPLVEVLESFVLDNQIVLLFETQELERVGFHPGGDRIYWVDEHVSHHTRRRTEEGGDG